MVVELEIKNAVVFLDVLTKGIRLLGFAYND